MEEMIRERQITKVRERKNTKLVIRTFEVGILLGSLAIGIMVVIVVNKLSHWPNYPFAKVEAIFCILAPLVICAALVELYVRYIKLKSRLLTKHGFQVRTPKPSS